MAVSSEYIGNVGITALVTSIGCVTFCSASSRCLYLVVAVTSSILVVSNISVTTSRTFVGCVTHSCASGLFFVYYYIAMTCCRNYIRCICVSAVFTSVIGVSFCSTGRLNSNKVVLVACHRYICNLFVTTHRALLCYRTHLVAGCIYEPNFLIVVGNGACGINDFKLFTTCTLANCDLGGSTRCIVYNGLAVIVCVECYRISACNIVSYHVGLGTHERRLKVNKLNYSFATFCIVIYCK